MKNGFYERCEIRPVVYEFEHNESNDVFLIATKSGDETCPIVINGEPARELIQDVVTKINKATKNKEES